MNPHNTQHLQYQHCIEATTGGCRLAVQGPDTRNVETVLLSVTALLQV